MAIEFLYFDFGRVLVDFDHRQMYRQMAEVAGCDAACVEEVLQEEGLMPSYERGEYSEHEFHARFCERLGVTCDQDALLAACSDIFSINVTILPILSSLWMTGTRVGVLSNTCRPHWGHCMRNYEIFGRGFSIAALSFELGCGKPDPVIFDRAARLVDVSPESIFFVDDIPENVAGARAAGFDAVEYTSAGQLQSDLLERGIPLNM